MLQVLGASLGFTMGCTGQMRENQMRKDLTSDFCQGQGDPGFIADLHPTEPVDALALRTWTGDSVIVDEVAGNCDGIAACPDEPPGGPGTLDLGTSYYFEPQHLVAYRGDQTFAYYSEDELRAFLGTIDTPGEARLLLALAGHRLTCDGDDNFKREGTGYVFYTETGHTCGENLIGHVMRVSATGEVSEEKDGIVERGDKNCVVGRLPGGLCFDTRSPSGSELGEYMARTAYLEAASVAAFEDLERELRALGAPESLCAWAFRAAAQERRHALACRALARKFGASAGIPQVQRGAARTPLVMACDNAREGLTREAFGALIAQHQALCAADGDVQRVMQHIARDELSHAEFSVALHHYLMSLLDATERDQVEAVRQAAITSFGASLLQDESAHVRAQLGLPDRTTAHRLFTQFFARSEVFRA